MEAMKCYKEDGYFLCPPFLHSPSQYPVSSFKLFNFELLKFKEDPSFLGHVHNHSFSEEKPIAVIEEKRWLYFNSTLGRDL